MIIVTFSQMQCPQKCILHANMTSPVAINFALKTKNIHSDVLILH